MPEKNALGTNRISQIALVVKDVEKTAQAFADVLGVETPQWSLTDPSEKAHTLYHGQPTEARAKLAFFHLENITIELIEPVGGPSTWAEALEKNGEGVHHIAFNVADTEQVSQDLGDKAMPLAQTGDYTGGRYAYIDSGYRLGVVIELLQRVG